MQIKNLFALATLTLALTGALTGTAFGQWHPDFDIVKARQARVQSVKSPYDAATGQIKSPRDVASGQATGKAAREAGSGLATGKTKQVQPGQNSGGTISNQRRNRPSPQGYTNGGVEHEDTWDTRNAAKRMAPHDKYANQEVSYRRNAKLTQVTHDADFEQWASLKGKRSNR